MTYADLRRRGKLKDYQANPKEIKRLLQVAERDLVAAKRNLSQDADWAFAMAYNAILQAARALMFSHGYRPRGKDQHRTVVQFTQLTLGGEYELETTLFDQMRRKRNRLIYETTGLVSQQEAKQTLVFAETLVEEIRLLVSGQLRLDV